MTKQELIDLAIREQINMVLIEVERANRKSKEEHKKLLKAEEIIDNLPIEQRDFIEYYIGNYLNNTDLKEKQIYIKGFSDGVKTLKDLINL